MMTLTGALAGVGVAAVLLVPLALKWQLPLRVVGAWIVIVGALSGAVWTVVLGQGALSWTWLLAQVVTVGLVSAAGAATAFFRDPERVPPATSGAILSPADGEVLYVRKFTAGEAPPIVKHGRPLELRELTNFEVGEAGYLIGIGMHLLNVHVNRAPVAGRAVSLIHTPGRFLSLKREEATTVNERFTTVIEGQRIRVVVVQIASRLVRRIVSYLTVDQDVSIGQRIGMIKFGSQVDVILPDSDQLELCVRPGEIVRAGVSVLGLVRDAGPRTD
jgi:phosphatidylserine decarboxylase